MSEGKSKRGKWTSARVAQWWGAISASLAILGLQVFYYKWRPSDIMINILVSFAIWQVVFLAVAWLITKAIALFRRRPGPQLPSGASFRKNHVQNIVEHLIIRLCHTPLA